MNALVGGPLLVGGLGPGTSPPPLNPALLFTVSWPVRRSLFMFSAFDDKSKSFGADVSPRLQSYASQR